MELFIGTKAWSSWSLRPWLALKRTGAPFTETLIALRRPEAKAEIARISPSGWVPALKNGDLTIWDSLAICEYLADQFPDAALWPADLEARALGRAAAAEMHSGFGALRSECPMDLGLRSKIEPSDAVRDNVGRIVGLWNDLRARHASQGPYLLGQWSIADAFYTPVATRLRSYGLDPAEYGDAGVAATYVEQLLQQPDYLLWEAAALAT